MIAAEGEQKASRALKEAADVISQSPSALQLRYLQTLNMIAAEKNSTIIFPLPMDLIRSFTDKWRQDRRLTTPARHAAQPTQVQPARAADDEDDVVLSVDL